MSRTIGLSFAVGAMALTGALLFASPSQAQTEGEILEEEETSEEKTDEKAPDEDDGGGGDDSGDSGGGGGLHFGLRLGFGFPFGEVIKRADLSDALLGQVPIWVDLGYQFSPRFMLGGYFSYGFGILASKRSDACDAANADCSASVIRLGVQGQYAFSPGQSMNPWVGAGLGYEWFNAYADDDSAQVHGWEPMVQGGLDFGGDTPGSTIGPFVAVTFTTYSKAKTEVGSATTSGDLQNTAMHNWIFVGVRGLLN